MRFIAFGLACLLVLVPQTALAGQIPLEMTLGGFVAAYNEAIGEPDALEMPEPREEQVFGVEFLPAKPEIGLFVQLAYDSQNDIVLFCGAILDPGGDEDEDFFIVEDEEEVNEDDPNFEMFRTVTQALMKVVFPELSQEEHLALLELVLCEDEELGTYDSKQDTTQYVCIENGCALTYVVGPGSGRNLIVYKVNA